MRDEIAQPLGIGSVGFAVLLAGLNQLCRIAHRDSVLQGVIRDDEQDCDEGDKDTNGSHSQARAMGYRPNHGNEEPDGENEH